MESFSESHHTTETFDTRKAQCIEEIEELLSGNSLEKYMGRVYDLYSNIYKTIKRYDLTYDDIAHDNVYIFDVDFHKIDKIKDSKVRSLEQGVQFIIGQIFNVSSQLFDSLQQYVKIDMSKIKQQMEYYNKIITEEFNGKAPLMENVYSVVELHNYFKNLKEKNAEIYEKLKIKLQMESVIFNDQEYNSYINHYRYDLIKAKMKALDLSDFYNMSNSSIYGYPQRLLQLSTPLLKRPTLVGFKNYYDLYESLNPQPPHNMSDFSTTYYDNKYGYDNDKYGIKSLHKLCERAFNRISDILQYIYQLKILYEYLVANYDISDSSDMIQTLNDFKIQQQVFNRKGTMSLILDHYILPDTQIKVLSTISKDIAENVFSWLKNKNLLDHTDFESIYNSNVLNALRD